MLRVDGLEPRVVTDGFCGSRRRQRDPFRFLPRGVVALAGHLEVIDRSRPNTAVAVRSALPYRLAREEAPSSRRGRGDSTIDRQMARTTRRMLARRGILRGDSIWTDDNFFSRRSSAARPSRLRPLGRSAPPASSWPIGCFNRPWTTWSFDEALKQIKAAGYQTDWSADAHEGRTVHRRGRDAGIPRHA